MRKYFYQLLTHLRRLQLRNIKSVIFALFFPVFFYLLYTVVFVMPMPADALKVWQVDYMISMIIYGVLLTSVSNVANVLLTDHENHFDLFVELSPSTKWQYYLSIFIVYVPFYLLLTAFLAIIAYIFNQVTLNLSQWVGLILIEIFALFPFSLIGVIISYARNNTSVNILANLVSFPLAILGGLWWPLEMMPENIQQIGRILPSYQSSQLIKQWVHSGEFSLNLLAGLFLWLLLLLVINYIIHLIFKRKEPQLI